MTIADLQAQVLELLKIESVSGLTEDQCVRLIQIGDALWALGSRIPDNV